MRNIAITMIIIFVLFFGASRSFAEESYKFEPVYPLARLEVAFVDSYWDGKTVPFRMNCQKYGGLAQSPGLMITGIPEDADAIIMEYSDLTNQSMDRGGHGVIGVHLKPGSRGVMVPSIKGHTFELPEGFFIVKPHRKPELDKAGAYLPPCSGGKGDFYYLTVKAVKLSHEKGGTGKIIGQGMISLGTY